MILWVVPSFPTIACMLIHQLVSSLVWLGRPWVSCKRIGMCFYRCCVCMHACVCVCVCVRARACMHVCVCVCMFLHVLVCMYVLFWVCFFECMIV